ncbi:alpha-amylase [Chitinophaga lutea]|uniref:Alpha-amylase n=1 Tax=Chitinophaga lutea TaxID=2488634 RepID=A0A3N4Q170_9BACT|nr:alpha-amylase family glycosyl hydrolase [Chitinophaga lutea]RPE09997.1 alpha-amylase [Chitinophaga lutea]
MASNQQPWWQTGIIYQVYPRSFQDSNGDGVGDLKGIRRRLDHLQWLGIDAIWLSPIFPSPMADFGYDVSNYTDIHPLFGNLADFDELLQAVHARGMKLLLDLVPNHTSHQHPWFLESRSSRDNPKRDWYIWKDPQPDGSLPNNWLSVFGGSGWEWDERTEQYYYHAFLKEQPDLNWRNPEVQEAMFNVMRFWLDKGVDGFRVDVLWFIFKDEQLRDNPVNPDYAPHLPTFDQLLPVYSTDQPEVQDITRKMRSVLEEYEGDRVLIAEVYLPIPRLMAYYGENNNGAHLPFNFLLMALPWDARQIAATIDEYEGALPPGGWPNWVLSNHDRPRIASRVGMHQAAVAAMLLLTLRGTPTIYYGDEIAMRDVAIPREEIQDPQGLNMPDKNLSRDPARTPMQWDEGKNAGFSPGKPWLRLDKAYARTNVQSQRADAHSMLRLFHRLIQLRRKEPALSAGSYNAVYADSQVMAFTRRSEGHPSFLIVLNLTHRPGYFRPDNFSFNGTVEIAVSRELEGGKVSHTISLDGDEGLLIRLHEPS